jgi:hypothetical protein
MQNEMFYKCKYILNFENVNVFIFKLIVSFPSSFQEFVSLIYLFKEPTFCSTDTFFFLVSILLI